MSERDRPRIPEWARQERAGDLAWINENLHIFWPVAQQGYETLGRGAIIVDTTSRPTGGGHPFGYLPQEVIEERGDEDTQRLVREYDPNVEMVTVLLKTQARLSAYRVRVIHSKPEGASRSLPLREKLTAAAAIDYPTASEILVSFPDEWEIVGSFKRGGLPLYVAGLPPSQEGSGPNRFFGLPAEINRSLTTYRLYKLFEPWPQPTVPVAWDETKGEGRVLAGGQLKIQLQPLGQAQVWTGLGVGVLWECYLHETRRSDTWLEELYQFWRAVEADTRVGKVFTQPHEPTFEEGYPGFLANLGYAPDPEFSRWWSKQL